MPWSQLSPMDQKTQFIADYIRRLLVIFGLTSWANAGLAMIASATVWS